MAVLVPGDLDEALIALADAPDALVVAGGTDAMVEVNAGHRQTQLDTGAVIVIDRLAELRHWRYDPDARTVTIGAGVTYTQLMTEPLRSLLPAFAEAARTVGSPQIRNAGTIGGNLATCSPAGDILPPLVAHEAIVHLASQHGTRDVPVGDFMVGVKQTTLAPGELITGVTVPLIDGWQGYAKVGVRNAMVIAIATVCVAVDPSARATRIAMGAVAPTIVRARDAEQFADQGIDWHALSVDAMTAGEIGDLAASAASPIDDHRSSAAYRRRAVAVLTRRLVQRGLGRLTASEVAS